MWLYVAVCESKKSQWMMLNVKFLSFDCKGVDHLGQHPLGSEGVAMYVISESKKS